MADLVKYRERFMVRAETSIEVRVTSVPVDDPFGDGDHDSPINSTRLTPWFQCITCGDALEWKADAKFWECVGCGYELTAVEATALCEQVIESIKHLQSKTKKKRGFLWRLSRLFVGKTRRMSVLPR